jgi:DNA polymerase III alpha subunit (gram-positive type)
VYDLRSTREWLRSLYGRGFRFPNSYLVFDLETTGLDTTTDVAIQIGYLIVENGQVVHQPCAALLNWSACSLVDQFWLRSRLTRTAEEMRRKGNGYKFTYEMLKDGLDPVTFLNGFLQVFNKWQEDGLFFIAHNGFRYDTRVMEQHFKRFLGSEFRFDSNLLIDTGLFEKAIQQRKEILPNSGTVLVPFYNKITDTHSTFPWNLIRHCIPKYRLTEKYGLDIRKAHTADFDCYTTHALYQEFRKIALLEEQ